MWLCLNNAEYVWIHLNKQSSDYFRIQNVSVAVNSIRSLYKLLSIYRDVLNMSEYGPICLNVPQLPDHGWILLNVPEYAWKCLNKKFWLCQGFQFASSSYIFDRVLNMPQVLDMAGFWICHDMVTIAFLLM